MSLTVQTVTLNGQTRVALTTPLIRAFRIKNMGSSDFVGDVHCYVNTAITGGVPDDSTQVRALVVNGNNQTEMAVYTVPMGKTAYIRALNAASAGSKKDTNYIMKFKVRPFGGVFQLKHRFSIADGAPYNLQYIDPEGGFPEKSDIVMTAETSEPGITEANVSAGFDIVLIDN